MSLGLDSEESSPTVVLISGRLKPEPPQNNHVPFGGAAPAHGSSRSGFVMTGRWVGDTILPGLRGTPRNGGQLTILMNAAIPGSRFCLSGAILRSKFSFGGESPSQVGSWPPTRLPDSIVSPSSPNLLPPPSPRARSGRLRGCTCPPADLPTHPQSGVQDRGFGPTLPPSHPLGGLPGGACGNPLWGINFGSYKNLHAL